MSVALDLSARRVLVAGASSGVGRAVAEVAARAGAHVALLARRRDRLDATVAALTEKDVLVKVDDKNPLRMRFQKQAIQTILKSDDVAPVEAVEAESK
jgi:NADP-dependent 3-hydroxy acid dehydrogenase YdfG